MRRTILLTLLAASACAPERPREPTPGAVVTLATFTGKVDAAAGTFEVRTDEPAPRQVRGGLVTIPTDGVAATIANSGASWNRTSRGASICANAAVTGANVVVTAKYPSPTFLGGVYAQIDSILSGTGVQACTGNLDATPPDGLSNTWGLWSYGSLGANGTATAEWDFVTGSAASFTFRGSLRGVVGDQFAYGASSPSPPAMAGALDDLRRVVAYSPATRGIVYVTSGGAIAFVNLDGTLDKVYTPAAGAIQTLAVHPTASTVWFTKWTNVSGSNSLSYGLLQADGTLVGEQTYGEDGLVTNIAPDPNDATGLRALFVDTNTGGGRILAVQNNGGSDFGLSAATPTDIPVRDLAFGGDGKLYVTGQTNTLRVCTTHPALSADCTTTIAATGGNPWTVATLAAPDKVAYGVRGTAIYKVASSGAQTQVGAFSSIPVQVASGAIWFPFNWPTQYYVQVGHPNAYAAELLGTTANSQLAASPPVTVGEISHPGYLWVGGSAGIYRVRTD